MTTVGSVDLDWRDVAYAEMTFNAPLSEARAAALVDQVAAERPTRVLDVGCGWGELVVRVALACPAAVVVGVDLDPELVRRAQARAAAAGVAHRVDLVVADAASWQAAPADVVVMSGVSHAFGGVDRMLSRAREVVAPGGLLVLGEAVARSPLTPTLVEMFGDLPSVDGLGATIAEAGFAVLSAELATLEEWDSFEASFRLEASADPALRGFADERRREYEDGYRGVVGYLWAVARG